MQNRSNLQPKRSIEDRYAETLASGPIALCRKQTKQFLATRKPVEYTCH